MFDEHESGQLRIGAQGDTLELLPLADAGIPDAGHVATPAELEAARRVKRRDRDGEELSVPPTVALEAFREALSLSEERGGQAFRACSLARLLAEVGALKVPPEVAALLERERHSGRLLDAHEAARALRAVPVPASNARLEV